MRGEIVDGHGEGRIKKSLGENSMRVIRRGWGKRT
jgi:hypothetical protein